MPAPVKRIKHFDSVAYTGALTAIRPRSRVCPERLLFGALVALDPLTGRSVGLRQLSAERAVTGESEVVGCALFGGFGGAKAVIGGPLRGLAGTRWSCVMWVRRYH
jgi:hypothetical protein